MRPERDDTETRGPRGLGKGDVRGVVEVVRGEHLPKPTRREEVALRRGSMLEVAQGTVYISRPGRSWIRPWRWCRRRQQRSCWGGIYVDPEEGILHALRARTRSLPNTCQTTQATCHERQATAAPLWPSGVGGRRPPQFLPAAALAHARKFLRTLDVNIKRLQLNTRPCAGSYQGTHRGRRMACRVTRLPQIEYSAVLTKN